MTRPYSGRAAALATMHGKENAIAPALQRLAGVEVEVSALLDTDRFGTFTRDIDRQGSMEDAALAKARAAMALSGLTLGLASEGSYGPHPLLPFVAAGRELLVFVDDERDLVVRSTLLTMEVCFASTEVTEQAALEPFLARVDFPRQWLVLRPASTPDGRDGLSKGVDSFAALETAFAMAQGAGDGRVLVETDMRAMANPTRMAAIGKLAAKLGERLACSCPACGLPGFGEEVKVPGLPCEDCGEPTRLAKGISRVCGGCGHAAFQAGTASTASAAHCDFCNP